MGERYLQQHGRIRSLPSFSTNKYSDEKLQSFTFCVGMPIVCLRNKKYNEEDLEIHSKNDWRKITDYNKKKREVTVVLEDTHTLVFPLRIFFRTFYPGFAITTHQAQGSTIEHDYAIADSNAMQKNDFEYFTQHSAEQKKLRKYMNFLFCDFFTYYYIVCKLFKYFCPISAASCTMEGIRCTKLNVPLK